MITSPFHVVPSPREFMNEHSLNHQDEGDFINFTIPIPNEEMADQEHLFEPIRASIIVPTRELTIYERPSASFERSPIFEPVEEPMEERNEEPLRNNEDIDVQGTSLISSFIFFSLLLHAYFIINVGLRECLDKLTLIASHTRLDYSFPNEHLAEFLFAHYPLNTIREFVDMLVSPCIESLHLISTDYIYEEYNRRWDVSSTITRVITLLENDIGTLRLRILRTQDSVTHELMNYDLLHAERASYEVLQQKKVEMASLKAELSQLTVQLGDLQGAFDGRVKEYIAAQRSIGSINTEISNNTQEAKRLLDQITAFISRMPGYP